MHVVIMGCGRTGSLLAGMLTESGQQVTVIDWLEDAFTRLPENFPGDTIRGNAVDQDVLKAAGIATADVFIAATSGDNRNIMASEIAKKVFAVPQVISRIKDPDRAEIFHSMGIEVDCRTSQGVAVLLDLVASG
jgi:trk system potassium uptake protein TrkA